MSTMKTQKVGEYGPWAVWHFRPFGAMDWYWVEDTREGRCWRVHTLPEVRALIEDGPPVGLEGSPSDFLHPDGARQRDGTPGAS